MGRGFWLSPEYDDAAEYVRTWGARAASRGLSEAEVRTSIVDLVESEDEPPFHADAKRDLVEMAVDAFRRASAA